MLLDCSWTDKYSPIKLDDFILNEHVKNKINTIINNNVIPNIIITGGISTGKSSLVTFISKQLLGDNYNKATIKLNASDKRGLETIKNGITQFCKRKIDFINHKIIILDGADSINKKAQNIISNLISLESSKTRFIFTCDKVSNIIEPIQSKCIIIKLTNIKKKRIYKRLEFICKTENIKYDRSGLKTIIIVSNSDIRQSINILESTYYGYGNITKNNVYKICDKPCHTLLKKIIDMCLEKQIFKAIEEINKIKEKGYSNNDILLTMKSILPNNYNNHTIIKFMQYINESYYIITEGIDTDLQIYNCLAKMCKI